MIMKYLLKILPAAVILASFPTAAHEAENRRTQDTGIASADTIITFSLPSIPAALVTPETRADYLARHYWDNMDFADTNYVHHSDIIEQAWVDFCDLLGLVPPETARQAMRSTIARAGADPKVFSLMTGLAETYLYEPDSPMVDEEMFITVLEAMLETPVMSAAGKRRTGDLLSMVLKNRPGTKALDFGFTSASGQPCSLYATDADFILIFFNSPGCRFCAGTLRQMKKAAGINRLLDQKRLAILSVYPGDDVDRWRRHIKDFPDEWVNGFDEAGDIMTRRLYNLKTLPALYLLDREKVVLLKDTSVEDIEEYLSLNR